MFLEFSWLYELVKQHVIVMTFIIYKYVLSPSPLEKGWDKASFTLSRTHVI